MATAAVTYSFTAGTPAVASQVNTDFSDLTTFLNTNVVHKDGSVTMTGGLTLPDAEPGSDNQATRRKYVRALQIVKTTSSYDIGTSALDILIPPAFTMPTITSPQQLAVEFYVPWVQYWLDLGANDICQIELRKTDNTILQVSKNVCLSTLNPCTDPIFMRYVFNDNSVIAAGASAALKVRGITSFNGTRLTGSSTAPIFYSVHWL